jgi:hypothetical protein
VLERHIAALSSQPKLTPLKFSRPNAAPPPEPFAFAKNEHSPSRRRSFLSGAFLRKAAVFLLLFFVAGLLQYFGPTWKNEINVEPDDPAHYVTALMLHDYIRDGLPASPMRFAEVFYAHYPKVAIGHWPPVFYILQAGWMLIFGTSIRSDLILMMVLSALLGTTVYVMARRELRSEASAISAAFLLLAIPVMQLYSGTVLADLPVTLFSLWAVLCWANYLESGRLKSAIAFSCLAATAILTKGNGFAVLLVPCLTIIFTRRFDLLKNGRLWLGSLPILFSLSWSFLTRDLIAQTMLYSVGTAYFNAALRYYTKETIIVCGFCICIFVFIGAVKVIFDIWTRKASSLWVSVLSLVVAIILFYSITPTGFEQRYLLMLLPPIALLMAKGAMTVASELSFVSLTLAWRIDLVMAIVVIVFGLTTFSLPSKRPGGFAEAAAFLTSRPEYMKSVILISSEGNGEGPFIARVAEFDHPRPNHIVLRASHAFADSSWNGQNYQLLMHSPDEVENYLLSVPVGAIVIDQVNPGTANSYQHLLVQAIAAHPEKWKLAAVFPSNPAQRAGKGIEVYRMLGNPVPRHPVVIRAAGTLRRQIVIDPERRPW